MCDLNFLLRLMSTLSIEVLHKKWSGYLWIRKLRCKSRKVLNCLSIYNKKQRLESRSLQWWTFRGPSKVKVLSSIFRLVTKLRMIISRLRPEASYRYQQGHPFFPFGVECVSLYSVGRSVGRIEKKKNRKKKKNYRKSLNRRPDTPASLLWSLETTRHELKRIWQKRWLMLL